METERERVLILDFGGQYDQLIARRVREWGVYCEILPWQTPFREIEAFRPGGIIFTGGPGSVYEPGAPDTDPAVFGLGVPILGICYGCQLLAARLGGEVIPAGADAAREYGRTETAFSTENPLFQGLPGKSVTWMSHGDFISRLPEGFRDIANSEGCPTAAICDGERRFYGVQFHPEVRHTEYGREILRNFLYAVCGFHGTWTMENYRTQAVRELREKIGEERVLLALSGGVDSSVCAALLAEAVGEQLTCVFVDHGLLRKGEGDEVEAAFAHRGARLIRVNAGERFRKKLAGIRNPEEKRKRIGEEFIRVFEEESRKLGRMDYLAQGTIYPDVIESGLGSAAVIKSHHNVGGLPDTVDFREILEPLRLLFKDEVRQLGRELGLPEGLVSRQPFPGPGLGVRIVGEITPAKVKIVQEADYIFRDELAKAGADRDLGQYFAALSNMRSVGVQGDHRTYGLAVVLRAVLTSDFMTAEAAQIPWNVLQRCMTRIINEVPGVNRVLYDITSKPPGTIELE